ncbi:MAG: hypothetical protein LBT01_05100 [Spirochaetaceae bacterium]|jgi:hypothetical protein|nr:hypothetical protein [Spirochaetaceae bacterium]
MDIAEMTVCDADKTFANAGASVRADDNPYKFYALNSGERFVVTLMMPLGGVQSGLYRFPKVGEKVLVAHESGNTGYLLGYVPSSEMQSFHAVAADMDTLIKNQGQVFRYQKTGTNTADKKYSEIGFSNEQTQWKTGEKDSTGKEKPPPNIDRITLDSTGDMKSIVQNYSGAQAKRMEIVVGKDLSDHTKKDALGAVMSPLRAGDLSINAKNDIVISSDSSITLKVGRSSISITDMGIVIKSGKINAPFTNTWDTQLALSPTDGIAVSGAHAKINVVNDFTIQDSFGGGFSSNLGVSRVNGVDIKLQTIGGKGYGSNVQNAGVEFLFNTATMVLGLAAEITKDTKTIDDPFSKAAGAGGSFGTSAVLNLIKGCKQPALEGINTANGEYQDFVGALVGAASIASQIAGATVSILSSLLPWLRMAGEGGSKAESYIRDTLNAALSITESLIAFTAAGLLIPAALPGNGTFHIQAGSMLYQDAHVFKGNFVQQGNYEAPLAGIPIGGLGKMGTETKVAQILTNFFKPLVTWGMKFYSNSELNDL